MVLCRRGSCCLLQPWNTAIRHASTKVVDGAGYQPHNLPVIWDSPTPWNSSTLRVALGDLLKDHFPLKRPTAKVKEWRAGMETLDFDHQFLYFHDPSPYSNTSPDGSNPRYSPGPPFTRLLWTGGRLTSGARIPLNGLPLVCLERIQKIDIHGEKGKERAHVTLRRTIAPPAKRASEERYSTGSKFNKWYVTEERTLLFLRPKDEVVGKDEELLEDRLVNDQPRGHTLALPENAAVGNAHPLASLNQDLVKDRSEDRPLTESSAVSTPDETKSKAIRGPLDNKDFAYPVVPKPELLMRYSFLTHNYHKIHFDKQYTQRIEGYRNLLVHGPLSLNILMETLRLHRRKPGNELLGPPRFVKYKHIAPLYAEEQMTVCGRYGDKGVWQVWILGANGRIAVRAQVHHSRYMEGEDGPEESDDRAGAKAEDSKENGNLADQAEQATEDERRRLERIEKLQEYYRQKVYS